MERHSELECANKSRAPTFLSKVFVAGVTFGVHLFVTIVLIVFLGSVVPRYIQFFEAHDTVLPSSTLLLITLSWWNTRFFLLLVIAFIVVDAPM